MPRVAHGAIIDLANLLTGREHPFYSERTSHICSGGGDTGANAMTFGILFVSVWFTIVAAYLLWQFAADALRVVDAVDELPAPVILPVSFAADDVVHQPAPARIAVTPRRLPVLVR